MILLVLGGAVVFLAALLGGATGFGFGLVSAPLLLVLGFPLKYVVTANLALGLLTRISVAVRFREHLIPRFAGTLILFSVPGLVAGTYIVTTVSPSTIKTATGILIVLVVLFLALTHGHAKPRHLPGSSALAGFLGGFLGATTSLNGIPGALLLTRNQAAAQVFQANMAVYFVISNTIALILLAHQHTLVPSALFPTVLIWLPGALIANLGGAILSTRISARFFRWLTLIMAFLAGTVTALHA